MFSSKIQALAFAAALPFVAGPVLAADKIAETAAEHQQAAAEYQKKAEGHKAEAEMHKSMAAMYATKIKEVKGGQSAKPNPWLQNMIKHCNQIAKKSEALAVDEEQAAKAHTEQAAKAK
jgi:hypothetical protein